MLNIKEMVTSFFNSFILAIVLPFLRSSPLYFRIVTNVLLYTAALITVYLSVVYIQSIGSFASAACVQLLAIVHRLEDAQKSTTRSEVII
jgi:hypothetical protein